MDVSDTLTDITNRIIKRIDDYEKKEVSLSDTLYYILDDRRCVKHLAEENPNVDSDTMHLILLTYYTSGKIMAMLINDECEVLDGKTEGKLSKQYAEMYFKSDLGKGNG